MPTTCGHQDSKGTYCKWGESGAHYYYTPGDKESMERARKKADAQGAAVHSTGWHEKSEELPEQLENLSDHSGIQSLRFDKDKFSSRESAISWAQSHGFKSGDVEEKPNEWRLRQFDPNKCIRSGGMKDLAPGVRGYVCSTKDIIEEAKLRLSEIKKDLEALKKIKQ